MKARKKQKTTAFLALGLVLVSSILSLFSVTQTEAAAQSIPPNARFDWILSGAPNPSVFGSETGSKVMDLDPDNSSAAQISSIKSQGITVICYFSAGSDENWRSDHSKFTAADTNGKLDDWPGELKLLLTDNVKSIMTARLQRYASMGCDGVEPDNTDQIKTAATKSVEYDAATAKSYILWLSGVAHSLGLSVALKNNAEQAGDSAIVGATDFAVVEECHAYSECSNYLPFIKAGKAVFEVEYGLGASDFSAVCSYANSNNIDAYMMNKEKLDDSVRKPCRTSGSPSGAPVPSAAGSGGVGAGGTGAAGGTTGTPETVPVVPVPSGALPPLAKLNLSTKPASCGLLPAIFCDTANSTSGADQPISVVAMVINFIAVGVGIVILGVMVWAGLMHSKSAGDAAQMQRARKIFINGLIALVVFLLMTGLLNWLVPGGLFN